MIEAAPAPDWQSLGVGGILVVFIVRELFAYLKAREQKNDRSGDKDPAFWQMEFKKAVEEGIAKAVVPLLAKQNELLDELLQELRSRR